MLGNEARRGKLRFAIGPRALGPRPRTSSADPASDFSRQPSFKSTHVKPGSTRNQVIAGICEPYLNMT